MFTLADIGGDLHLAGPCLCGGSHDGNQRPLEAAMIGEQCRTARIVALQIVLQCDAHEDRALRVLHDLAREVEDMSQPVTAAGGDEQHEVSLRVEGCA